MPSEVDKMKDGCNNQTKLLKVTDSIFNNLCPDASKKSIYQLHSKSVIASKIIKMEPEVLNSHAGMEDLHKCKRFPDDLISDIQNQISKLQE